MRLVGALMLVLGATAAQAQGLREMRQARHMSRGGLGFLIAQPVGEFANFVDVHPGVGASVTVGGPVGLRFGGSLLVYGRAHEYVPVGSGRLLLDIATTNMIGSLGVGPQLTLGSGPMRLYGYSTIGFSYFATVSSLGDGCGCYPFGSTTDFDDFTFAQEAGGGLEIALTRGRAVLLDLSARYLRNGQARYLREGSIFENGDGTITVQPIESAADLVVFQVGLSFGFR
jgi:hypothetical protein